MKKLILMAAICGAAVGIIRAEISRRKAERCKTCENSCAGCTADKNSCWFGRGNCPCRDYKNDLDSENYNFESGLEPEDCEANDNGDAGPGVNSWGQGS